MNYALIENGVVTNVIWLHPANADDFPGAVPVDDVPVDIGDTYADGTFYRNGEKVLTFAEQMQMQTSDMRSALNLLGVNANE